VIEILQHRFAQKFRHFGEIADSDASVPAAKGMGTPDNAPVATADIRSLRRVRMSSVISPRPPFNTSSLALSQPLA
jgi:hypothetical protein